MRYGSSHYIGHCGKQHIGRGGAFLALVLMLLCLALPVQAEEAAHTATLTVQLDEEIDEISPYLYGQFIEHIESCIYNGIWSEMVLDRKFYYEVGASGLSPWRAVKKDLVSMETELTCGDAMAARIQAGGGLKQTGITLEAQDYTGYIWAACPDGGEAKVRVVVRTIDCEQRVEITVSGGELKKYAYGVSMPEGSEYGFYEIFVDSGVCVVDSVSLMPADNINGMRADTLAQLKKLNASFYRWPGGNFLSGYNWKDGVGERDWRASKRNLHYMGLESSFASEVQMRASDKQRLEYLGFYGGIEPNDYGMDEFLSMCEYLECEPMIIVNSGLGTVEDAADQVEYLNGGVETMWGAQRAANGHAQPYDVQLFGIGNEMFGDWQLGHMEIKEYWPRHNKFAQAMLAKDEDITLIGVGDNTAQWTSRLLRNSYEYVDYVDEHLYSFRHEGNIVNHVSAVESNLNSRLLKHRSITGLNENARDVGFMLLEYAYNQVFCPSRMKDALGIGVFMNVMINNADIVKGAAYSSTVNATQGCITTTDTDAVMQGGGYTLTLYRREMGTVALESKVEYEWGYMSVSAALKPDTGEVTVAVVNPHNQEIEMVCEALAGRKVTRYSVVAPDPEMYNSAADEAIHEEVAHDTWTVQPYSLSIFVVK